MPHLYSYLPDFIIAPTVQTAQRATTVPRSWLAGAMLGLASLYAPAAAGQGLFKTNGNATTSTTCSGGYTLTPDAGNQAGSVWRLQQITLAKSFVFNFNVYLGNHDGGDGMVFALQRNANGVNALGGGGQNMGMAAISPSISVEFDTYDNGSGIGDISADHLAIIKNGDFAEPQTFTGASGATTSTPAAVNASGTALDIENNTYYPVRVTWNVNTKTLQVYFNGALRATYTEDIVNTIFGKNPLVYWGFTASTGGATNKMEACSLNFNYDLDTDGLTDNQDADDDNDGIADADESGATMEANGDADNDGILNYQDADYGTLNANGVVAAMDFDGDGIINQFDLDSDADGIPDVVEGTNGQMSTNFRAIYSAASGQYTTSVSTAGRPQSTSAYTTLPDTDADGRPDYLDTNSDGDAVPDWTEAFDDNSSGIAVDDLKARAAAFLSKGGSSAFYPNTDTGNAGAPDWLKDSNGNGIPNFLDPTSTFYHDTDGDGLVDLLDPSNLGVGYADVSGIPDRNRNAVTDYRDAAVVTPLPVQLTSFVARATGGQALLTWATAAELNNAYFVVEISLDGQHFEQVGRVAGAGTSDQAHAYRFTDENLPNYAVNLVYYRLRQVDADGKAQYSAVETVAGLYAKGALQAQPNPFSGALALEVRGAAAGTATLVVTNATGQTQLTQPVTLVAGVTPVVVPQAAGWPAGVYLVRVVQGAQQYLLKVVRE
ncbi:T9SS type A sorting domain-containing protein [Hymenobacter sp. HSC-4F20]|uniref:lectin-like domain-containing protein n=1 Tax=Hymenobacter sp. HSC-4F20 TaxID=2864135 RepID=UPI001C7328D1|nr:T9SS type A sorting domain-containing protein [Hymenobacter sp. HSC-4F20]MBX0291803.1 T9SS type A sorting domain-containing protein [Hymenobacter sp. HSC-4F20]